MAGKLREIVEEETFIRSKRKIKADARQLDRALWAVTWALGRSAEEVSWGIPGTSLRVMITDPFREIPRLLVFLSIIDDDTVSLRWIEPEASDAES